MENYDTEDSVLWEKYKKTRDIDARNELVTYYRPLVKIEVGKLISQYSRYIDYDDLMSCGYLGLIDAVEKFDSSKGVKFRTYAVIRIRGFIIDQLRKQDWLPARLRQKIKKVTHAYDELEAKIGRVPTDEEVAKYLGIEIEDFQDLVGVAHAANVVAFDDLMAGSLGINEPVDTKESPESSLENKMVREALISAVNSLNEKEKIVISLYYYEELTLKEIGGVIGVSESRVSQIHSRILGKLKKYLSDLNM